LATFATLPPAAEPLEPSLRPATPTDAIAPPAPLVAAARGLTPARYAALMARAAADPTGFWGDLARACLAWERPFTQVLDATCAPHYKWFGDGALNVSVQCLDRHLPRRAQKPAIIFERETGEVVRFTYAELHAAVCRFANGLKALGVVAQDRVVIMLPNAPEAVIAMQACARIGAVHSVVFGGFAAAALRSRIEDAGAKVVVTADGGIRGGKWVAFKTITDQALAMGCPKVEKVVVFRRGNAPCPMQKERDIFWSDLGMTVSTHCSPTIVPAEHPLFILYTSGSTGRPKGVVHSSAGYMLGAILSLRWAFELTPDDVYWCTADVGWITGHTYVAYGPLAMGACVVLYEGTPTQPHGGRMWEMCARHGVNIFYTSPTAVRALMQLGDHIPAASDLSQLRVIGTVGEPINPEAWRWLHTQIGGGRCPVVDTWWQTETGMVMMAPVPAVVPTKPGSCSLPLPGIAAAVVDAAGEIITEAGKPGYLVITAPWPAMARTLYNDDARFVATYWAQFKQQHYVSGDGAYRDADGFFWVTGRLDDVLNVSGHRLGTAEIESSLAAHVDVAEAAVVGRPDAIKGESVFAFIVLRGELLAPESAEAAQQVAALRRWVTQDIGALARPDTVQFVAQLPKTRSGKVMRRLLRALARGEAIVEDTSTLEDPTIIGRLQAGRPVQ
jgi:acetyl-CoA synthetase